MIEIRLLKVSGTPVEVEVKDESEKQQVVDETKNKEINVTIASPIQA